MNRVLLAFVFSAWVLIAHAAQFTLMGVGSAAQPSISNTANSNCSAASPTQTCNTGAISIGTADADRFIIAAVCASPSGGTGLTSATLTLDGNAMTQIGTFQARSASSGLALFALAWPTNTTATFAVTHNSGGVADAFAIFAAKGILGNTFNVQQGTGTTFTLTTSTGVAVAMGCSIVSGTPTITAFANSTVVNNGAGTNRSIIGWDTTTGTSINSTIVYSNTSQGFIAASFN